MKATSKPAFDYGTSEYEPGDEKPKGPLVGFLTSRIMITEREPIRANDKNGASVGQLIDARIEEMRQQWASHENPPQLHAITFEFPQDY